MEQHSIGWYRQRLGQITGSQVGRLMKKGRTSYFGDDAMSYIYQLAAERCMSESLLNDDVEFEEYLAHVNFETKAMRFGTEMEAVARDKYCSSNNVECTEVGLCSHFDIEHFASSPDGIVESFDGKVALEIKCPTQAVFMRYCDSVIDQEDLKKVKPEYYWQCMAHMMCTGAIRTDFIVFCPFQENPIKVVPIYPDEKAFGELTERVREANNIINSILMKANGKSNYREGVQHWANSVYSDEER